MLNIYQEELIDHYKHPRNYGQLENPTITTVEHNPSCGDSVQFFIMVNDHHINAIKFMGKGCVISLATASIVTEYSIGKTLQEILLLQQDDILRLIGIHLGPTRLKCALLPLMALQKGVKEFCARQIQTA